MTLPAEVEQFVYKLYGSTNGCLNKPHFNLFTSNGMTEGSLPPTKDALTMHTARASLQSYIWCMALEPSPVIPSAEEYGWKLVDGHYEIKWMDQPMGPPELLMTVCLQLQNERVSTGSLRVSCCWTYLYSSLQKPAVPELSL